MHFVQVFVWKTYKTFEHNYYILLSIKSHFLAGFIVVIFCKKHCFNKNILLMACKHLQSCMSVRSRGAGKVLLRVFISYSQLSLLNWAFCCLYSRVTAKFYSFTVVQHFVRVWACLCVCECVSVCSAADVSFTDKSFLCECVFESGDDAGSLSQCYQDQSEAWMHQEAHADVARCGNGLLLPT